MNKLIYTIQWAKDPQKTWSGIGYNLRNALAKHFEIEDLKLQGHCFRDYFVKLRLLKPDCGLQTVKTNRFKHSKKLDSSIPVFQFDEAFLTPNSYLFCDLCVDFLYNLKSKNPAVFNYSGFQNNPDNLLRKRAESQTNYIKNFPKRIFTLGTWLRNYLITELQIPENKVIAVGGGINIDKTKINNSQKTGNKILFIGRDFKRKGGECVVEAFKELKKIKPNVELYIAGPKKNPLDTAIDGITYLGDVNSTVLHNYFNLCDIFCMPSYFEAYGLVFIEALTFGLPCIGRDCFEMPYLIDDEKTGYLLKNDSTEELCTLMKKALENEEMKNTVLNMRESYLKQYSWETVAQKCALEILNN